MLKKKLIAGIGGAVVAIAAVVVTMAVFSVGDEMVPVPEGNDRDGAKSQVERTDELNLVEIKWKTGQPEEKKNNPDNGWQKEELNNNDIKQEKETD